MPAEIYYPLFNFLILMCILVFPYSAIVHGMMGVRAPWERKR
jgi:hypothetical protein